MTSFHTYLSNRAVAQSGRPITCTAWNTSSQLVAYGQDNGNVVINTVKENPDEPGLYNINIVTTLSFHKNEITSINWSDRHNKLCTGDKLGTAVIWSDHDGKWMHSVVNTQIRAPIKCILPSSTAENIIVCFENGNVFCSDIGLNQKWLIQLDRVPEYAFWSEGKKHLYVSCTDGIIYRIKNNGKDREEIKIKISEDFDQYVCSQWSSSEQSRLLLVDRNGEIDIYTSDLSEGAITTYLDYPLTAAAWSNSGRIFVVAGVAEIGRCILSFFTADGEIICSLDVTGQAISSLSFNHRDSQVVMGVDSSLALVQLIPKYIWACCGDTIVYAVEKGFSSLFDLVFFNFVTGETHIKTLDKILSLSASDGLFAVASHKDGETALLVLDKIGIPVASNFVKMSVIAITITGKYVAVVSERRICVWDTEKDTTKFVRFENTPTALLAKKSKIFVAFDNFDLFMYSLPSMEKEGEFKVSAKIEKITVSSDLTRISVIDCFGDMCFIDVHSSKATGRPRVQTWDMEWASDSPDLFVALERQKLIVYHDFESIEAILALSHICSFDGLKLVTVDFIKLFADPLKPSVDFFKTYETKMLRDVRLLLESVPSITIDEVLQHIRSSPHPVLWRMLGRKALQLGNLKVAETAFGECGDSEGRTFVARIRGAKDRGVQQGYVEWLLGRYGEAEAHFEGAGEHELTVEMLSAAGEWGRLAAVSSSDDSEVMRRAFRGVADEQFSRGDFREAAESYAVASSLGDAIRSLAMSGEIAPMVGLLNKVPPGSKYAAELGRSFVALGSCEHAVSAFMRAGDAQSAVTACMHFNNWEEALRISDENASVDKRDLIRHYATYLYENGQVVRALKLFKKFRLAPDMARIMQKEADIALRQRNYVFAKKCFVFAALMHPRGDAKTYDPRVWHRADALHFMLLAHRLMYAGEYEDAVHAATAALRYADFLGEERTAALLALCGYFSHCFKQCSTGFITLENTERFTPAKRQKMKLLAVKIFGKNRPNDDDSFFIECPKCKKRTNGANFACECGLKPQFSVASGRPILGRYWRCRRCLHCCLSQEVTDLKACPMCHQPMSKK